MDNDTTKYPLLHVTESAGGTAHTVWFDSMKKYQRRKFLTGDPVYYQFYMRHCCFVPRRVRNTPRNAKLIARIDAAIANPAEVLK
jgi:hypothetical protein